MNSLFLPEGLLYTTLLTPLFFYELEKNKMLNTLALILGIALVFFILHLFIGVQLASYLKSFVLLITVVIFCLWFIGFCKKVNHIDYLFKVILYTNTVLTVFALLSLKFGFLQSYFWYMVPISPGIPIVPRLKMFTYEASYYSLLLTPLVFYYLWQFLNFRKRINTLYLVLVLLPLALSFSMGVIAGILITMALAILLNISSLSRNTRLMLYGVLGCLALLAGFEILYHFYPNNPLVARLKNIPAGKDTSARGRTYEALQIAFQIAAQKSLWLGAGLGQIKEIGRDIIINFYQFIKMPNAARIPNAVGETMAMYGFLGLLIRFSLIVYCFFKTTVYKNYYRLSLFIFIFIYQFTGSYFFNIAEYVIWILAFSALFPEFNKPYTQAHE